MNAAQLIEALKALPPETEITTYTYDDLQETPYYTPVRGVDSDGRLRDWEVA